MRLNPIAMNTPQNQSLRASPKGFTLLELIVSVSLFTVVTLIAMSAYITLIELNRKARATNDLVSNLSFITDSIGRSIRTGTDYKCGGGTGIANCPEGASEMSFINADGTRITYLLARDSVMACVNGETGCTVNNAEPLSDPRITVDSLTFYVLGAGTTGSDAAFQPRAIIVMKGTILPDPKSEPISFNIQTSATQRLIDIP